MPNTNLSPDEWSVHERLMQALSAAEECPGLNYDRFKEGVIDLQNQLLDLSAKRKQANNKQP